MRLITRITPLLTLIVSNFIATCPGKAVEPAIECRGEQGVCQSLVEGERALTSMLVSGDVTIVHRLFANDAVWTLANGVRWTKQEAAIALRKAPRMASSQLVRVGVYQHGQVAIVSWSERWRDPKKKDEQQSFGTDTWVAGASGWQIVASQEARLPSTP